MPPIVTLLQGDSIEVFSNIELQCLRPQEGKIFKADAVVTDPPYGFDFGGSKDWDSFEDGRTFKGSPGVRMAADAEQFAKFTESWCRAVKDNLWPGAHVLAFADNTTVDLLGRGMRLANLDIVRGFAWLYASGQVKNSDDVRPGYEPIMCGRFMGEMGNLGDLKKLFKQTGRGQLHAQTWKEEDGKHPTNVMVSEEAVALDEDLAELVRANKASFFVPKPNPKDRDAYCGELPLVEKDNRLSHMTSNYTGKVMKPVLAQNFHPTVKPIELMRRLIRLVSRPGGTIIDPFAGSGTTGVSSVLEGRNFIGCEREPEYFVIAATRIAHALHSVGDEEGSMRLLSKAAKIREQQEMPVLQNSTPKGMA
jgi:site-specific DNA-methyltransferase (adenine-specific)